MKKPKVASNTVIPMKCPVCTECYREANLFTDRCAFGGPYAGYTIVKDKNAPVV